MQRKLAANYAQMQKSQKRNTIKEVAAAAGFSVATVSRALQRPEVVTSETRRLVHDAIRRLGYTPNAQARILRTAKTRIIIALVSDIANPFFSEVIRGIEQVAHSNGYSVLLGDTQDSLAREQTYADMIAGKQADGLITLSPRVPNMHIEGRLPLVNVCECVKDKGITSIGVDNIHGAFVAVTHLLTLGHQHIAFIAGPASSPLSADRRRGYEQALESVGHAAELSLVAPGDFSVESGLSAIELLLARRAQFSAVFCSNDEMAIGAIRAIKARGLRVPQDISVVGFDDIRFARYTDPPLTTVAQPKNELGREAMSLLLELLSGAEVPARKRILPVDLVVRASTAQYSKLPRR